MSDLRALRRLVLLLPLVALLAYGATRLQARSARPSNAMAIIGKQDDGTYLVPTGQTVRPAGESFTFNSRPVDMALRPDGKLLALMLPSSVRFFDVIARQFT